MGRLEKFRLLQRESLGNSCSWRILSQLGFLLELSSALENKFDNTILPQIEWLYDAVRREGAVTNTSSQQVEKELSLLGTEAKNYHIYCVLQPHFLRPATTDPTPYIKEVRQALALLEDYPQLCYFEPRPALYRLLEQYQPVLLEKVKEMVKFGRWEVGLTSWSGLVPEKQTAQRTLYNLEHNRTYLSKLLSVPAKSLNLHFQLDCFSPSTQMATLLNAAAIPYSYTLGGNEQERGGLVSFNHSELVHLSVPYQKGFSEEGELKFMIAQLFGREYQQHYLRVLTLGKEDTRTALDRFLAMREWPLAPQVDFCSLKHYFTLQQKLLQSVPCDGPAQNLFSDQGFCHQPLFQDGGLLEQKESDSKVLNAQSIMLCGDYVTPWPFEQGEEDRLNFTSTLKDTVVGAEINLEHSLNTLCLEMNTQKADYGSDRNTGFEQVSFTVHQNPIHHKFSHGSSKEIPFLFSVFNPAGFGRSKVMEVEVPFPESFASLVYVTDSKGKEVPFQVEGVTNKGELKLVFLAQLPSFGYMTYRVEAHTEGRFSPNPLSTSSEYKGGGEGLILENQHLRVCFSAGSMSLISFVNKELEQDVLNVNQQSGNFYLSLEEKQKNISPKSAAAQSICLNTDYPVYIKNIFFGPVRCWVDYEIPFYSSLLQVRVVLDQKEKSLRYEAKVHWAPESFKPSGRWNLSFQFPFQNYSSDTLYYTPWGVHKNPHPHYAHLSSTGVLAISSDYHSGLLLTAQGHHSLLRSGSKLQANLLTPWSSKLDEHSPDYSFALGVGHSSPEPEAFVLTSLAMSQPVYTQKNSVHEGALPAFGQLVTFTGQGVLSSAWAAEPGAGMYLRFYNPTPEEQSMTVDFVRNITHATLVDFQLESYKILHRPLLSQTEFSLPPEGISTLKVIFA